MSILDMSIEELVAVPRFTFDDLPMGDNNSRITIFALPNLRHNYVIGGDFAQGMASGDFDAFPIFDRDTSPWRQVAVAHGRWGPTLSHKVLYTLLRFYNDAFLCGERQVGLAVMRTLVDEYGYTYMYYERDEKKVGKPMSDRLGHWTGESDVTMTDLRRAVRDAQKHPEIVILDGPTLTEIEKMQWMARGEKAQQAMLAGRVVPHDHTLKAGTLTGLHDDLVIGTALALKGLKVVGEYEDDKPASKYPQGTYGSIGEDPDEILARQDRERRDNTLRETMQHGIWNPFLRGR